MSNRFPIAVPVVVSGIAVRRVNNHREISAAVTDPPGVLVNAYEVDHWFYLASLADEGKVSAPFLEEGSQPKADDSFSYHASSSFTFPINLSSTCIHCTNEQ